MVFDIFIPFLKALLINGTTYLAEYSVLSNTLNYLFGLLGTISV